MKMLVLKRKNKDGVVTICGLYSTKKKAKTAATGMMMHLDWMYNKPGKWTTDEREHEIVYSRPDGEVMTIDYWQVDKALVNGQWKIL